MLPALLLSAFVFAVVAIGTYAPPAHGEMAVVFAPGTSEQTAYYTVLAAGGRFVGPTRLDNIVVAYAADAGFAERVRVAGALFLLAAHGLCAPSLPEGSA
jgi:hypothetical protein